MICTVGSAAQGEGSIPAPTAGMLEGDFDHGALKRRHRIIQNIPAACSQCPIGPGAQGFLPVTDYFTPAFLLAQFRRQIIDQYLAAGCHHR